MTPEELSRGWFYHWGRLFKGDKEDIGNSKFTCKFCKNKITGHAIFSDETYRPSYHDQCYEEVCEKAINKFRLSYRNILNQEV